MTDKQMQTGMVLEANRRAALAEVTAGLDRLRAALDQLRAAAQRAAQPADPAHEGTRFLVLCTSPGHKSGRVTVGESRLMVPGVLTTVRAHGAGEAAGMWPQLSPDELSVLEQLAEDLAVYADNRAPTRAEVQVAAGHHVHCWAYGDRSGRRAGECRCAVAAALDALIERGWLRVAPSEAEDDW